MKTYILFLFGNFDDHEDIEFFCMNVIAESKSVSSLKYVIDNLKNLVVIFDSNVKKEDLIDEIDLLLNNENVLFYFMFEKESLLTSYIPESMANLIFKPIELDNVLRIEVNRLENKDKKSINLDDILDKIEKSGLDSLTPDEKKFLDNFEK